MFDTEFMTTLTNTKGYRETKAALAGKSEQELATLLTDLATKAEAAKTPRTAAKHWHAYFAVQDTLRAGWSR